MLAAAASRGSVAVRVSLGSSYRRLAPEHHKQLFMVCVGLRDACHACSSKGGEQASSSSSTTARGTITTWHSSATADCGAGLRALPRVLQAAGPNGASPAAAAPRPVGAAPAKPAAAGAQFTNINRCARVRSRDGATVWEWLDRVQRA